jgi:hypothetical protein
VKLLYKPLSILTKAIAAKLGKSTYRSLWSRLDDADPPAPTTPGASFAKVLEASILEAATMAAFAAAAERAAAQTFHYLFGVWPGEKRKKDD